MWQAGEIVEFMYDGTYWRAIASDMGFVSNIRKNAQDSSDAQVSGSLTVGTRKSGSTYGANSFAVGEDSTISGAYSVGFGCGLTSKAFQVVFGNFNNGGTEGGYGGKTGDALIIGNGTTSTTSNAFRVTYAGAVYGKASYNSSGADYAEMFEWEDGNPSSEDRRGLFAYVVGDKIRLATSSDTDKHRLGIISAYPAVVGDNFDDEWHGKYLTDIYGNPLTQTVHLDARYNEDGECIMEECDVEEFVINPDYDPDKEYIPRTQRKEYAYWSFIGKLVVRDDGTCTTGGYCYPDTDGVATDCTDSDKGYYVMERLDDSHIRVLVR